MDKRAMVYMAICLLLTCLRLKVLTRTLEGLLLEL